MEFSDLFKQAKAMQEKAAEMQAQLAEIEVEGTAGGGLVRVTMSGKSELKRVKIDPCLLKPDEARDRRRPDRRRLMPTPRPRPNARWPKRCRSWPAASACRRDWAFRGCRLVRHGRSCGGHP